MLFTNCSKEEVESGKPPLEAGQPPSKPKIKDLYTYIALRNDGTIFEIGDETGQIKEVGKIPETTVNIAFNTLTGDGDYTYLYATSVFQTDI